MKKIKITESQLKFLMENKDEETIENEVAETETKEEETTEAEAEVSEVDEVVAESIKKIKANFKRFI